jgi:predicted nucleic acid-binding protein
MERSSTVIVRVRASDERHAREIIATYDDKDFSLIDALSFAVMERLGITHAFSLDRHFAQYGFILLDQPS